MLHGIGRVAHSFDHIAPRFNKDYHVIAIDMRGHGDSAWSPEGAYLVEDYAKDLAAFVEQLNLRNVVLLGKFHRRTRGPGLCRDASRARGEAGGRRRGTGADQ